MQTNNPIVVVGAGIAGLTCAYELLKQGKHVRLIDSQDESHIGGLAKDAFGGMALVDTPLQKFNGIKDTKALAWQDWLSFANFSEDDIWPKKWAKHYIERSKTDVYDWVRSIGVNFLPAVNWVERGDLVPGNSVPRYHVIWGTGHHLIKQLLKAIKKVDANLTWDLEYRVEKIDKTQKGFTLDVLHHKTKQKLECSQLVLACGGINGNLEKVRTHWDTDLSPAPKPLLNGSHPSANGALHEEARQLGARITHLNWMWNYAAGIKDPENNFDQQGLSLIPPKTALWLDAYGKRIGPEPMISCFDTHNLCHRIANLPHQYSWQIMNQKIAEKEIAVSGAKVNPAIRDRKFFTFLKEILFGNKRLVKFLTSQCEDVIVADSVEELVEKMNRHAGDNKISLANVKQAIEPYDRQLRAGTKFHNDDQLRRLAHLRNWPGDKLRTCKSQPIVDKKAGPLIAIKECIISRKSMGGMLTNLQSQILDEHENPIGQLYALGEAAGFGGGGISGHRSLEGTFLSCSILTARRAAEHIIAQQAHSIEDDSQTIINRQAS